MSTGGAEPRFAVGDLVRVRPTVGGTSRAVWRIERRDHWHADTEPAYELRYGKGPGLHVRFAFDSELERVAMTAVVSADEACRP